eukprot:TRINITY_DN59399_c0_g1_i1.p1 TRINITY_DN59399_c0_g1~~TRINITY_DN59399_c0_g1_i1.p1  ORF type:complete len:728 (+),score=122.19 TRINITY_DN59399_c0_g1_i1:89-2272(+)
MAARASLRLVCLLNVVSVSFADFIECDEDDDTEAFEVHVGLLQLRATLQGDSLLLNEADIKTGPWGLDLSGMNISLEPGNDFYGFVNGAWEARTEIPADKSQWGAISELDDKALKHVHTILEDSMATYEKTRVATGTEIGRFYAAYMNESRIEELGLTPLGPWLQRLHAMEGGAGFAKLCAEGHKGFGSSPFTFGVSADEKDPSMNVAYISQAGLSLPDRDYYLKPNFSKTKKAFEAYVTKMLDLVGWPNASERASELVAFETAIARVSWPRQNLRDPDKTYNKMKISQLDMKAPGFDWAAFAQALGIPFDTEVVVNAFAAGDESGVVGIAKLVQQQDSSLLEAWLAFHLLNEAADALPRQFYQAKFDFAGRVMSGMAKMEARWKRAVREANAQLADLVGQAYVTKHFPESAKAKMEQLTAHLKIAFRKRLQRVAWMANTTKAKALDKLDKFTFETGYPMKWRTYKNLRIEQDGMFVSLENAKRAQWTFQLGSLGKPVEKAYWSMPPQTVNAFFEPTKNRCVFLAGILQPPFFDPDADMSVNYGSIGAVIGHEMTHGFDDEGRKYDAEGRLSNWWTEEDAAQFTKLANRYGAQFARFTQGLPDGMHINPKLTMGENIADLGGVNIALEAYHTWREENPDYEPRSPLLQNFRPDSDEGDRRFFAGWAQVWRSKMSPASKERQLVSDVHSPPNARVTIPLQNIDSWYEAFAITDHDALFMNESSRVAIW